MNDKILRTITNICDQLDKKYNAIPKDADHSAINTMAVKSFEKLTDKINETMPEHIVVSAGYVENDTSNLYIAYADTTNLDEAKDTSELLGGVLVIPEVDVSFIHHDFNTSETSKYSLANYENSLDVVSELIKNVPIVPAMVMLANYDMIKYDVMKPSRPIILAKIIVNIDGISAIFTTFVMTPDSCNALCAGLDIPERYVDSIDKDDIIERMVDISKIFSNAILIGNLESMDEYFRSMGINADNVSECHDDCHKFRNRTAVYSYNNLILHYEDEEVTVDVNAVSFVHD